MSAVSMACCLACSFLRTRSRARRESFSDGFAGAARDGDEAGAGSAALAGGAASDGGVDACPVAICIWSLTLVTPGVCVAIL